MTNEQLIQENTRLKADIARIECLHDELKERFTEVRKTLLKTGCFSEDSTALGMAQHLARIKPTVTARTKPKAKSIKKGNPTK